MNLLSPLIGRNTDVDSIRRTASSGLCVSLVGVSNLGKSALMRHLCETTASSAGTFVYIDCNQMPERTARALFITLWRAITTRLPTRELRAGAQHLYDTMIAAPSSILVALTFDAALAFALDHLAHPLVLCLDDFDEAYQHLEPQVWLNLRAYKDLYGDNLAYVTTTERELARLTQTREQGEFLELVAPHIHYLHFMEPEDTRAFCERYAQRAGVTFSPADIAFIQQNTDGHPGLAQAVCHALGQVTGAPTRDTQQDRVIHQMVQQNLAADANAQAECAKIWQDLEPDERDALLNYSVLRGMERGGAEAQDAASRGLRAKYILRAGDEGPVIFSRLFADFVRQQRIKQQPITPGVYVDADQVFVDGKRIESLTDLEYRLLLFLYGHLDRVCDKYAIVESVWGEEYIDQVDDARIEKLVSRVRQKIEPDAAHPRYLMSVRGRGYKLVR